MLLINKADYLSPELIKHWNQYFTEKGVKHIFFSALKEQDKIDHQDDLPEYDEVVEPTYEDTLQKLKVEDAVIETA